MKKLCLLFLAAAVSNCLFAQLNLAALQDEHNSLNASQHLPTYLGDHFNKIEVSIINPYVSLGSTFASFRDAQDYLTADKITSDMIDRSIAKLQPEDNNINAALDLSILNVAINIGNKSRHTSGSIGFGVNERVELNGLFNDNLLVLAYKGNKQFAGQTINIIPRFNGIAFTEYYVSGAAELRLPASGISIKPAVRLSYLSGQASVSMPKGNMISLYTEPDGRYLDFGFDYNINASLGSDSVRLEGSTFNVNDKNLSAGSGSGFGVDFGVRVTPSAGLSFNLGVMDVGSIRFRKGVTNIYNHSSYHYEGEELTFAEDQTVNLDSLAGIAKPNYSHDDYSMRLPTKLVLTCNYGIKYIKKRKGGYYKHQFTGMYLQGFDNYLSSTTRPYVAVGYTHSFNNVLNLGFNGGVGGVTGGTFGILASLRAGAFRFGLNSNNIIPLIAPNSGRGADLGMLLAFAF